MFEQLNIYHFLGDSLRELLYGTGFRSPTNQQVGSMQNLEVMTKVHDMLMDTKGKLGAVGEELAMRRRTSSMTMTIKFLTK